MIDHLQEKYMGMTSTEKKKKLKEIKLGFFSGLVVDTVELGMTVQGSSP